MSSTFGGRARGKTRRRAERSLVARQVARATDSFLGTAAAGGLVLLAGAAAALVWANSPYQDSYLRLLETPLTIGVGRWSYALDLRHAVNEGLMTVFFVVVGLEVKREFTEGAPSRARTAALPIAAAAGGMVVPAGVFLLLNTGAGTSRGWGIPIATDIAFALGVLALVGPRVPRAARVFLLGLATADDVAAVVVIALVYTRDLSIAALAPAAAAIGLLYGLRRLGVQSLAAFAVVGALLWAAVRESGAHPTLAGVVLGLLAPDRARYSEHTFTGAVQDLLARHDAAFHRGDDEEADALLGQVEEVVIGTESHLDRAERLLHPWSSYVVLPVFAFANAGIVLSADLLSAAVASPVSWGAALGLVVGKPAGVLAFSWLAVRGGLGRMPEGLAWRHLAGVSLLAGIGFTVSIFITGLAFEGPRAEEAKVGVFGASLVAAAGGYVWMRRAGAPR